MSDSRSNQRWLVNIISFILFSVLAITGLTNWLILPRGPGSGGGFLILLRHFFRDVHEWIALIFIVTVAVHLVLHWRYIKSNLKRTGIIS